MTDEYRGSADVVLARWHDVGVPAVWDEKELKVLFGAYLRMLSDEVAGRPYLKAKYNREVQAATGRSRTSVEFKFANTSAVLEDLGVVWVRGYLPRSNYQALMAPVLSEMLDADFPWLRRVPMVEQKERFAAREQRRVAAIDGGGGTESQPWWQPREGSPEVSSERAWVEVLASIWEKATGGGDVAVSPDSQNESRFSVDPAPGVREACEWLKATEAAGGTPAMVFLVGGPGGGKSHALRAVTQGLKELDSDDTGLARRSYRYRFGASFLTVVNDASIPDGSPHPLTTEIEECACREYLLACVNRGILVEEASNLDSDSTGASVIRWLGGVRQLDGTAYPVTSLSSEGDVIRRAQLAVGGESVDLIAVSVDFCSLLEPRPEADASLVCATYKVLNLKKRAQFDPDGLPAGELLAQVLQDLALAVEEAAETNQDNPVLANVHSLGSPQVRAGLLTVLRAAEAAGGGRLSFREVWGAILRALVGDLPERGTAPLAMSSFPPLTAESLPLERLEHLRWRARYRFSEAIFGVGKSEVDSFADPVLRFTAPVDPVLDAVPGYLPDRGEGWASPVLDAFSGLIAAESPLDTLLSVLPSNDSFSAAVTDFDRALDCAFVAATQSGELNDRDLREVVAWYGDYLTRLYAVSNGIPAYRAEVGLWLRSRGGLPAELEVRLKTLLRPLQNPDDPNAEYLLPLFSSRTVPYSGGVPEPRLALKGDPAVSLQHSGRGDHVTLEMFEAGVTVGEIELDFALLRSAMACAEARVGVTERAALVGPRVERFRARRLTSPLVKGSALRVIGPHGSYEIEQED